MVLVSPPATGQTIDVPAHVTLVDGQATVTHEGEAEPASANVPVVAGDTLETTSGRLEVLFPDGSLLDLDGHSRLDLQSPTLVRLLEGRLILTVGGADDPARAVRYDVDTPAATIATDGPGEYRVEAVTYREGPATTLAVLRGYASLATERGDVTLGAGQRSIARDRESPSYPQAFNSARFDAFDRWAASLHDARTGGATARQYLPSELQVYGRDLDRAGDWRYEASYGYVWYPRVAVTWRPYYYGRWVAYPSYGWTWIGTDPWSWPTHHYGRWGHRSGVWFWIPGRTWAPAWVAWASASDYVAWSPLGFDGRPVFALSVGFGHRQTSWTCVPQSRFGHAWRADRYSVGRERIASNQSFVARREAPVAVPRGGSRTAPSSVTRAAPVRRAGAGDGASGPRTASATRAVPRRSTQTPTAAPTSRDEAPAVVIRSHAVDRSRAPVRPQVEAPRSRIERGDERASAPRAGTRARAVVRTPAEAPVAAPDAPGAPSNRGRFAPQVEPRRSRPGAAPRRSAPSDAPSPRAAPSPDGRRAAPGARSRASGEAPRQSGGASSSPRSSSGADSSSGRRARRK